MKLENKIFDKNEEVMEYINSLSGFSGYIQFSNREIQKQDIFDNEKIAIQSDDNKSFIYEAHFCDGKSSISIKQINGSWYVSMSDISTLEEDDIQIYQTSVNSLKKNIKMAQIWISKKDEMCENFEVKKLQRVVFAGFQDEKGEKNDNSTI